MRFGLSRIDASLGPARAVLLRVKPGVDASPLVWQAMRVHAAAGGRIVYLTTDRSPADVRVRLAAAGVPEGALLRFLDGHAPLFGLPADGQAVDITNINEVERILAQTAREDPAALLVIDSLSGLATHAAEAAMHAWEPRLQAAAARFAQALLVYVAWDADAWKAFPDAVEVGGVQERIITHEHVHVSRAGGRAIPDSPMLFRSHAGIVSIYVPKVVVTGPEDAGKTAFIRAVSERSAFTERRGTTVAGERGRARIGDVDVELFGTPGLERFDALLPTIMRQAVAAIVVVDATRPDKYPRAQAMLEAVEAQCRHLLIVASHQDAAQAASPADLAAALGVAGRHPIVGADLRRPDAARRTLEVLLESLWEDEARQ